MKAFDIPSIHESIRREHQKGHISLEEAAREWHRSGHTSFVDLNYARRQLSR
jgi:hypothetical protein